MTKKGRLSILRLAGSGILVGLLLGAVNAVTTTPAAGAFGVSRSGGPRVTAGTVKHALSSSHVVQSKQMSGRDNVVGGSGGGGGDSAADLCNADTAAQQCVQSNSAPTVVGTWSFVQGNQLSGRDGVLGGSGGGGGNNASGVCNAATATQQCAQGNTAVVGTGEAGSVAQGNQISGRDGVLGGSGGGGGNNGSGVCNAATAGQQCEQTNGAVVGTGGAGSVAQANQISGRDSVVGGSGGGGGNNGTGVCNAATAAQQCDQTNSAVVGAGGGGTVLQGNQISGRDSATGGAGGGGDNATGVCNAATAAPQCNQTNTALVASGGSTTVAQGNQISGRDSAVGGAGGGGNSAAGVCNAATADQQCEQANTAKIDQSSAGPNATTVSQGNQISGGTSAGDSGGGDANGVCNAATATRQCNQTNDAQVAQSGPAGNTATISQSNQISGPGACNAATAGNQCGQTNVAKVTQTGGGNNTATVSQTNQSSGQAVCGAAAAEQQCVQTNVADITQHSSSANSATVSQSSQVSTLTTSAGG